ncbi:MAG: type II secretion system protein GspD, partial [Fusobacteriaceae bacterium]
KSLVQILDKQSKQVRIAAQVIEITDNLFENLGFSWAYSSGSLKPNSVTNPNYPDSDNDIDIPNSNGNGANNSIGQQIGSGLVYPFGLDFFRFFNGKNDFLNFSINMLQATQDAVVSAIPSILVVNGETGTFKVTDESIISYDSEITENGFQSFTANLGEAGVILNVTPVIRDDDSIQLKIKVEVSKFLADGTAAKPTEGFANPKSQRIIETIVNVKNGDTIFIGGMKQATVNNGQSKVPFLGDVPILGELFKNSDVGNKISDLYIKLKIDIANHDMVKQEPDLKGFMMEEIHRATDNRGRENIDRTLYPQFPQY